MNEEEILKDDPLKNPKKITVAVVVIVIAVMMVFTFASFHWICADYFNFKANEVDARRQLDEIRARYSDEVSAAKKRLKEVEEKTKASEEDALRRAKTSENDALKRIQVAEQSSKDRIRALEGEYSDKRAMKMAEYQKLVDELDESIKAKKNDIAVLLRGYWERYGAKTNDFEQMIANKNAELLEIKRMISILPDVKGQLMVASNALVSARVQRDAALRDERDAQEVYGKWKAKVDAAKSELGELDMRKNKLTSELDSLSRGTNEVCLTMVSLLGQVKNLRAQIATAQMELQAVQGDIESAKSKLGGVQQQVANAEKKCKVAETARMDAEAELSAVLDKKREAESARDKAKFEASQAEAHWAKRKPEIEGLLRDMERILEIKSQSVNTFNAKKEEEAN